MKGFDGMKKLFKKNQVIITTLAIMIVIAGYLNFTSDKQILNTSVENMESEGASGNSDDAIVSATVDDSYVDEEFASNEENVKTNDEDVQNQDDTSQEIALDDIDEVNQEEVAQISLDENGEPIQAEEVGEAVLTNGAVTLSQAKINREQTRAKAKEMLLEIINNENLEENSKQEAINKMLVMSENMEKETAAETQLAAKGFKDCIVSISEDSVDVTVNSDGLSDKQRTQIEDIITRKTGCDLSEIVITTMALQ